MATTTTNFGLLKPDVNSPTDADLWGGYLNDDMDDIDALLKVARDNPTSTKTANYDILDADRNKVILVDATSGTKTIRLPDPTVVLNGFRVGVMKIDSSTNTVTVDSYSAEKVNGQDFETFGAQYQYGVYVTDGVNWFKIAGAAGTTGSTTNYFHVKQVHSSGANSGTFTAGARRTRPLNTLIVNGIAGASFASSVITLPTGSYRIEAYAEGHRVDAHQAVLWNTTLGAAVPGCYGSGAYSQSTASGQEASYINGDFTIGTTTTFELQHQCLTSFGNYGFGYPPNFGMDYTCAEVKIWKI